MSSYQETKTNGPHPPALVPCALKCDSTGPGQAPVFEGLAVEQVVILGEVGQLKYIKMQLNQRNNATILCLLIYVR